MMQRLPNTKNISSHYQSENGVFLPFFAVLLVALLAVVGLLMDMENLERTRVQLQKAVDAGVLAAMDYRIELGYPKDNTEITDIKNRAANFIEQNIVAQGFDKAKFQIHSLDYKTGEEQNPPTGIEALSASVDYDTPLMIMPYVPFNMLGIANSKKSQAISVDAEARVPRSNVILVLDTSNSMACPGNDPDCSCADPNKSNGITCDLSPNGPAKIYDLRRGVKNFIGHFRAGRDRIALVSFDLLAKTLVGFNVDGDPQNTPDGFDPTQFDAALGIDGQALGPDFQPGGLTNPSDGLLEAYNELSKVKLLGNERVAIVFFSDGAPTAKTSCYPNSSAKTSEALCTNATTQSNALVDLELEWIYADGTRARGPSPLLKRADLANLFFSPTTTLKKSDRIPRNFLLKPDGSQNTALYASPCSGMQSVGKDLNATNAIQNAYGNCLSNFGGLLPDNTTAQDQELLKNYKNAFYHRSLAFADYLRKKKVLIYSVGIGKEGAVAPKADAYQDIKDDFHRKDGYMMTVANSVYQAQAAMVDDHGTPNDPTDDTYPVYNYDGWETWPERLNDIKTNNAANDGYTAIGGATTSIASLFDKVATAIQLRLFK